MTMQELKELVQIGPESMTVLQVNRLAEILGQNTVKCLNCGDPELASEAYADDDGWFCRCCGRSKQILRDTAARSSGVVPEGGEACQG